ncbi:hypothetical protein CVT26_005496 [Gymnopilus dilepis]|uniref:Uncharacterized protein n=1 Tax=Gymnopilus dilepis TaxID=231916 RepID=A0A409WJH9_9AGAR|nr:hypothetical protein CVT26_005496 [Gymnopilus dilepis]
MASWFRGASYVTINGGIFQNNETSRYNGGISNQDRNEMVEKIKTLEERLSQLCVAQEAVMRLQENVMRQQEDLKRQQEDLKQEQVDMKRQQEVMRREQEVIIDREEARRRRKELMEFSFCFMFFLFLVIKAGDSVMRLK